jgi:HEAT repeat protein
MKDKVMKRVLIITVASIVALVALYFLLSSISLALAKAKSVRVLADVVATVDDPAADLAAESLAEINDDKIIPILSAGLQTGDTNVRKRIISVLEAYDNEAAREPLVKSLSDDNQVISAHAALALARQGETEMYELTKERRSSRDREVTGLSMETMGYFEADFIETLRAELNGKSTDYMPSAIRGLIPLVEHGVTDAWPLLRNSITSRYPEVRQTAFDTAVGLGGDKRAEALKLAVESSDASLRKQAIQEMSRGEDIANYEQTFVQALNDNDVGIKFAAAWGLYKLRKPDPVPYIRAVLHDKKTPLEQRIVAARILARFGDTQGADPMYDVLDDPTMAEEYKLEAAEVLGEYGEIKGMGYLGDAINPDRPIETRRRALALLGMMGDADAGALLRDMMNDPDEDIAVRSAYALTALGDRRGLTRLRRFLRSGSPDVRTLAAVGILTGGDITDIIGGEEYM